MTLAVTGGAGFIGSNFILYMREKNPDLRIISVDCLTYASNRFVIDKLSCDANFRFSKTDICDRNEIYRLFEEEKPDILVNFAAESHVDRSIDGSEQFLRTNVLGTGVLLDACLRYGWVNPLLSGGWNPAWCRAGPGETVSVGLPGRCCG